ncbi:MAG: hypothetical protein ABW034_04385 [Steroidobacteraceae bacterium]
MSARRQEAHILTAKDEAAAAEALYLEGRTDGLPIVVPTEERVEAMLAHSGGLDRDVILGDVGPAAGQLTVEKAAVNAVMAGCQPEIFPLVIAACSAVADPLFDAGPMQVTTHCITPFLIVNGPARETFNVNCGVGALGPGFRTNATLGRAVRFVLINVGGGQPGVGDMATLGTPAKFTCCMGEAQEESPWEPLHVSRGFAPEDSTVTALGVEGPHSFIFDFDEVQVGGADLLLRQLGAAIANPGSNNIFFCKGSVAVILQPLHVRVLGDAGLSRRQVQERLYEYASNTRTALRAIAGSRVEMAPHSGEILHAVPSPDDLLIMVGGAEGGAYSAFMPSWCGGANGQVAVTKTVRFDEYCEIPNSVR